MHIPKLDIPIYNICMYKFYEILYLKYNMYAAEIYIQVLANIPFRSMIFIMYIFHCCIQYYNSNYILLKL